MPRTKTSLALLWFATITSVACAGPAPSPPPASTTVRTSTASVPDVVTLELRLERRADEILSAAAGEEPETTKLLSAMVADSGSWLHKLEHRLKSRASLIRKLRLARESAPEKPVETLAVGDALRFMMVTPDEPPGAYVARARQTLESLESAGYRVLKVKNYWHRGDNYSAINCDLQTPRGFEWELQFQTPESLQANLKTRVQYEEIRSSTTAPARRRWLFDQMTEAWREVPIPQGALEPHAIHAAEELLDRTRPPID